MTGNGPAAAAAPPAGRWALFAIISTIFFLINGATFSSLGVVLPFMIEELSWTWSQAGAGFSLFALTVGLASTVPAWILRHLGIQATYGLGGAVMAGGFALLALTDGFPLYLVATGLLGLGFASCATVPAVYLLNGWMPERRSAVIGAYLTIGGLGAVAGPLAANGVIAATDSWRLYWWAMVATLLALTALAIVLIRKPPDAAGAASGASGPPQEAHSARVYQTATDWPFSAAVRTPQFWVIAASMTMILLCVLTTNSWVVAHLGTLRVAASVAAGLLSAGGAVSALARALGGALATRIDPQRLLVAALIGEGIGMAALSVADSWGVLILFAVAEGFGFGMGFFATAILLVNYFGPSQNPEIFGTFNLITTAAMIGPLAAGAIADRFGGFSGVFLGCAGLMFLMFLFAAAMRPPRPADDRL